MAERIARDAPVAAKVGPADVAHVQVHRQMVVLFHVTGHDVARIYGHSRVDSRQSKEKKW